MGYFSNRSVMSSFTGQPVTMQVWIDDDGPNEYGNTLGYLTVNDIRVGQVVHVENSKSSDMVAARVVDKVLGDRQ